MASSVLSGLAFVFFALNYWHQIDTASALKAESEQRARAGEVERSIALLGVMLSVYERELAVIETQASGPEAAAAARRKESVSRKISALHAKIDLLYGEILQFIGVGDVR